MPKKIKKIHIIGGPGSGKSYAAEKLSRIFHIKWYDLDDIFWDKSDNSYQKKASKKQRDRRITEIAKNKSWIVEGSFAYDWVRPISSKAELIIILNSNVFIRDFRIIRRFLEKKIGLIKGKKENTKSFFRFLKWNHQYNINNLMLAETLVKPFKKKVKYFKKADDAVAYVSKLMES